MQLKRMHLIATHHVALLKGCHLQQIVGKNPYIPEKVAFLFPPCQATGSRIGTVIQALTTLGFSISISLYYDWRLGLVSFPFIPFVLIAVYLQSKILMGQSVTESTSLQDAGKVRYFHNQNE